MTIFIIHYLFTFVNPFQTILASMSLNVQGIRRLGGLMEPA